LVSTHPVLLIPEKPQSLFEESLTEQEPDGGAGVGAGAPLLKHHGTPLVEDSAQQQPRASQPFLSIPKKPHSDLLPSGTAQVDELTRLEANVGCNFTLSAHKEMYSGFWFPFWSLYQISPSLGIQVGMGMKQSSMF